MKSITKWILESVAATFVIMVCTSISKAFDLPTWTLAMSVWEANPNHHLLTGLLFALFASIAMALASGVLNGK